MEFRIGDNRISVIVKTILENMIFPERKCRMRRDKCLKWNSGVLQLEKGRGDVQGFPSHPKTVIFLAELTGFRIWSHS